MNFLTPSYLCSLAYVEPLIEPALWIPDLLQFPQMRKAFTIHIFQRFVAMAEIDVPAHRQYASRHRVNG
jgi:hypothetical protein